MRNIEDFRAFVLSLGQVEEKLPFGKFARRYESTLVFYVCGHMFCLCDIDCFTSVGVRLTAEEIAELESRYPSVGKPGNPALKLWRSLPLDGSIPQSVIEQSVRRAYEIIKAKYTPIKFKPPGCDGSGG